MTVKAKQGAFPHIKYIDLTGQGLEVECAILKERNGNLYFIELNALDNFDKTRIAKIVTNRNAKNFELWDLMSQTTLNNGVNALDYFHQLVKMITPAGVVISPRGGIIGTDVKNYAQQRAQHGSIYNQEPTVAPQVVEATHVAQAATPKSGPKASTKKATAKSNPLVD